LRAIFRSAHQEQHYLSLEKLQSGECSDTLIDQQHLEMYLEPTEFHRLFGMSKREFVLLPYWTRSHLKRRFALCPADKNLPIVPASHSHHALPQSPKIHRLSPSQSSECLRS
jgi:hypothetical protein